MPRDVSSSSSEDEADNPATNPPVNRKEAGKKSTRYQCPADFVSFGHVPCSSTLTESLKKKEKELWLIKAPASFKPECFSGIKVPLSGLQTLKVPAAADRAKAGGDQQIFSILASPHHTSELRLLTSNKQASDAAAFGPAFSGLLNVCENYGDSSANQVPKVIPAAPAPSIPPGLKQRFHPFGSKTPTVTYVAEDETDGTASGPSSTTLRPLAAKRVVEEQEGEGRKKKKKKKKEKRIKMEREEEEEEEEQEVRVKVEPRADIQEEVMMDLSVQEGDVQEEKRKKKKKKKDREREEAEPSAEVKVEEVTVKSEPMDTLYGDVEDGSGKKKKKKKKSRTADD